MSGFDHRAGGSSSSSPPSTRTPRLAFPTTRSRLTSIVDTTATSVEASAEAILSTSPASSIASTGASPRKHTQSAMDRLASAQAKDVAAAAKSHRTRTTSATSRSSTEGGRPKLPSLLQATTTAKSAATPVTSTSLDVTPSAKAEKAAEKKGGPSHTTEDDDGGQSMSRRSSHDQTSSTSAKVAGPSTPKKTTAAPKSTPNAPPLVALLSDSKTSKLIKQGAEAKVYISSIASNNILSWPQPRSPKLESSKVQPPASVLLKWRFPKTYRHPTLSSNITASRTIMEARALLRCAKAGVAVPAVRCVDEKEGILGLELIAGKSVREWLGGGAEGEDETLIDADEAAAAEEQEVVLSEAEQVKLMKLIGKQLAIMHEADIIHGDLTTSNMMLRPASPDAPATVDLERDEVVLIDFGLSSVSAFAEDKAVDLYVLERAFASTHPASESLYRAILDSYAEEVTARSAGKNRGKGGKLGKWEETRRKLEEVRLRGRKRSMVGSALWKDNWNRRVVVNVELSMQFEWHGVTSAIRSLPALAGVVLRTRPTHVLQLLRGHSIAQRREGDPWHALASRMDAELEHIGSAKLLRSHTPHESCARTPPTEARPILALPLVALQSVVVSVPLARPLEKVIGWGLTRSLEVVDRVVPQFASPSRVLGWGGKGKTD
ncbi:related to p53-related protein kinase [Sporisorium reilianum f. sp. reilianum]|uniref:non-specific serine/threonine protein kinase n=1 Tax=Sporisorium reilianum f. sp. reilianum TaxID=72559 RepID=A0A2N8U663_9BASI|nr:related to p53-related protein kinase [Sporisorium reilianum f. sp. reilianum]